MQVNNRLQRSKIISRYMAFADMEEKNIGDRGEFDFI
jgi:hypothetical protein